MTLDNVATSEPMNDEEARYDRSTPWILKSIKEAPKAIILRRCSNKCCVDRLGSTNTTVTETKTEQNTDDTWPQVCLRNTCPLLCIRCNKMKERHAFDKVMLETWTKEKTFRQKQNAACVRQVDPDACCVAKACA